MPKTKKVFIFDLDGTLLHFPKDYLFNHALKTIADLNHPEVSISEIEESFAAFDFFKFVNQNDFSHFEKTFWKNFSWDVYSTNELITGTLDVLKKISKNGQISTIATSRLCCPDKLKTSLSKTEITNYLSLIRTKENENISFMDKSKQILEICDAFKITPKEAVMVGDIPPDITVAKDLGVSLTVAVLSGGIRKDVLEKAKPDYLLPDVSYLLDLL